MKVSPDTLLRHLLCRAPAPPASSPRVLGVDDWAYRKGQRYGTLLVDLEARRPVDLLPDRTSETFATWLRQHPGAEIIARDRSSEYSRAIRLAAPHVREVADRWHLLHNLGQALERFFSAAYVRLKPHLSAPETGLALDSGWVPPRRSPTEEAAREAARQRHRARYEEVRRLHTEPGRNALQIARQLQMSRITVRKYLAAEAFPERGGAAPVERILQPYEAHLEARWNAGCRDALQLWREIRALGYPGTPKQVHRWAAPRRSEPARNTPHKHRHPKPLLPSASRRSRLPAPRGLAWLVMRDPSTLSAAEAALLERLREDPEVAIAHDLARRFTGMIQHPETASLEPWLSSATPCGISALVSFAEGVRPDQAAVQAALELPWSSGQAEGQINRLKMLKRQMYGRAGFDLLRSRVLRAA